MRSAAPRWMLVGLLAQVAGVASEAAWAMVPAGFRAGSGTNLGFLVDHVVSNAGVAAVLVGALLAVGDRRSSSRAAIATGLAGATLEALGAAADTTRHLSGRSLGDAVIYPTLAVGAALVIASLVLGRRSGGEGIPSH